MAIVQLYPTLFPDTQSHNSILQRDIDVGSATPVKEHAYQCPFEKREVMKREVKYLLKNELAKPSCSPWSPPCFFAPKSDSSSWTFFCSMWLWQLLRGQPSHMQIALGDVDHYNVYLNDIRVCSDIWSYHISTLSKVFFYVCPVLISP